MQTSIDQNRSTIEGLCLRFGVERLEVFGSAVGGDFDPERSDLDFLPRSQTAGLGMSLRGNSVCMVGGCEMCAPYT